MTRLGMRSLIVLDDPAVGERAPTDWVVISNTNAVSLDVVGAPMREHSRCAYADAVEVPRWVVHVREHVDARNEDLRDKIEVAAYARGARDDEWRDAFMTVVTSCPRSRGIAEWMASTLGFSNPFPKQ